MKSRVLIVIILLLSGILGLITSWVVHKSGLFSSDTVQTIETFHYPALFTKQLVGNPQAGERIFKEFCATCHAKKALIDVHAPLIGDKKIWRALSSLGMSKLLTITIEGKGAMPSRGGCFECTDAQLRETIQYILNQSS